MSTPLLLEVSGLSKSFGPLKAVNNASFVIRQGQVVGLIGSNGPSCACWPRWKCLTPATSGSTGPML